MPNEKLASTNADYNLGAFDAIDSVLIAERLVDMTKEELLSALREVQLAASERLSEIANEKAHH